MKLLSKKNKFIILITLLASTATSQAQTWNVSYGHATTLNWTGVVDSVSDTLTISSWTNSASATYWTPSASEMPLVFASITGAAGSETSYDVPSNWDGTFNGWGFIAANPNNSISWVDGSSVSGTHIGWSVTDGRTLATPTLTYNNDVGSMRNIPVSSHVTLNEYSSTVTITPVPEPSSTVLIGLGSLAIIVRRRRS